MRAIVSINHILLTIPHLTKKKKSQKGYEPAITQCENHLTMVIKDFENKPSF